MTIRIEEKIEKANYAATDHDVELLAAAHLACSDAAKRIDGGYLRVLLAKLQANFGTKGRRKISTVDLVQQSAFLADTHAKLYPFVMKGVTTPEVMEDETLDADTRRARAAIRNGRAAFARSAASTLQSFVKLGGDVRGLDVSTVTKTRLRTWINAHTPSSTPADDINRAVQRMERDALALAEEDPQAARDAIEGALAQLQAVLDALDTPKEGNTITQVLKSRPAHTRQPAPAGRAHA